MPDVYVLRLWPPAGVAELPREVIVLGVEPDSLPIFGDVELHEDGESGVVVWWGTWYSEQEPEGESGTVPLGIELRELTSEEFERARGSGWRWTP
jgi:hypothetical protein